MTYDARKQHLERRKAPTDAELERLTAPAAPPTPPAPKTTPAKAK